MEDELMRALAVIGVCILVLVGGAIAWWKISYPTYTYRYRMTVEVLAGGAVRSGTSVIEVRIDKQPKFGSAPPQVSRFRGEAVFVDLGGGRNVIALLASGPAARNVDYIFNVIPTVFGLTFADRDLAKLSSLRGSRQLPASFLPTFVTFADLNDPKTVRVVMPEEFEQAFGPGTRLLSVTVEPVDVPVTMGIEQRMPETISQLREQARKLQVSRPDDPYSPRLGHFAAAGD
jgi:hypothetical protein